MFDSKEIAENTWIIHEELPDSKGTPAGYLIVGDEQGMMIDTCYGYEDIRTYCKTLTDKPVRLAANTHGHADHAGGNRWFDVCYMTPMAEEVHRLHMQKLNEQGVFDDSQVIYVGDGDEIDLGNRKIEIFTLEGHSAGSLCFLDRKARLLFTGDNIGPQNFDIKADGLMLWHAHCRTQPSLLKFTMDTAKLYRVRDAYDRVCWGHSTLPGEASIVEQALIAALRVLINDDDHLCEQEYLQIKDPITGEEKNVEKYQELNHKRSAFYKNARIIYDVRYMFATETGKPTIYY